MKKIISKGLFEGSMPLRRFQAISIVSNKLLRLSIVLIRMCPFLTIFSYLQLASISVTGAKRLNAAQGSSGTEMTTVMNGTAITITLFHKADVSTNKHHQHEMIRNRNKTNMLPAS